MEFEFDKEIDAILRQARAGEAVTSFDSHMDADEISAFAENALSGSTRERFTAHLADCTRCRKILSNTILLNSEAAAETASVVVSAPAAETAAPWYRRFFVFPQLAYTMGAMVVLLSGFFGYLIIKNLPGADRAVSYSANNQSAPEKIAPANTSAAAPAAANTNSATAAANTALPAIPSASSNASSTANSAPLSASNPSAETRTRAEEPVEQERTAPVMLPQATPAPEATPPNKPLMDGEDRDAMAKVSPASPTAGATQNRAKEEAQSKDDAAEASSSEDKNAGDLKAKRKQVSPKALEKTRSTPAGEARSVGGKTFNNVGGIWFDAAVGRQKQKTVRRGTGAYSKLDAGLRSIADQLGGTVVVLWGGTVYRIE